VRNHQPQRSPLKRPPCHSWRHAGAGGAAARLHRVGRHRSRRSRMARAVARSRVCRLAHPALIGAT
jgi:hypothetical protein